MRRAVDGLAFLKAATSASQTLLAPSHLV